MKKIIIALAILAGFAMSAPKSSVSSPIAPTPYCGFLPQGCPPPPSQG